MEYELFKQGKLAVLLGGAITGMAAWHFLRTEPLPCATAAVTGVGIALFGSAELSRNAGGYAGIRDFGKPGSPSGRDYHSFTFGKWSLFGGGLATGVGLGSFVPGVTPSSPIGGVIAIGVGLAFALVASLMLSASAGGYANRIENAALNDVDSVSSL